MSLPSPALRELLGRPEMVARLRAGLLASAADVKAVPVVPPRAASPALDVGELAMLVATQAVVRGFGAAMARLEAAMLLAAEQLARPFPPPPPAPRADAVSAVGPDRRAT